MDFIDRPDLPGIVAGFSPAELREFRIWCKDCLSCDLEEMDSDELKRAATIWIDENYKYSFL